MLSVIGRCIEYAALQFIVKVQCTRTKAWLAWSYMPNLKLFTLRKRLKSNEETGQLCPISHDEFICCSSDVF